MQFNELEPVEGFDYEEFAESTRHDYHAVVTMQLVELINDGLVDFSKPEWDFDSYDDAQRNRLYAKVRGRFDYREIGILPYRRWQERFVAKLNEIMPKYKPLYKALADGYDPLQVGGEYYKSRDIFSEFPQTMLSGDNQDYASTGTDHEHERINRGDFIDVADRLSRYYNDVDVMILNELESLFTPLMTVNMNGF